MTYNDLVKKLKANYMKNIINVTNKSYHADLIGELLSNTDNTEQYLKNALNYSLNKETITQKEPISSEQSPVISQGNTTTEVPISNIQQSEEISKSYSENNSEELKPENINYINNKIIEKLSEVGKGQSAVNILASHIVRVVFIKKDGSSRVLYGTRNPKIIENFVGELPPAKPTTPEEKEQKLRKQILTGSIPIFDIEAKGWRMLNVNNLSTSHSDISFLIIPKNVDINDFIGNYDTKNIRSVIEYTLDYDYSTRNNTFLDSVGSQNPDDQQHNSNFANQQRDSFEYNQRDFSPVQEILVHETPVQETRVHETQVHETRVQEPSNSNATYFPKLSVLEFRDKLKTSIAFAKFVKKSGEPRVMWFTLNDSIIRAYNAEPKVEKTIQQLNNDLEKYKLTGTFPVFDIQVCQWRYINLNTVLNAKKDIPYFEIDNPYWAEFYKGLLNSDLLEKNISKNFPDGLQAKKDISGISDYKIETLVDKLLESKEIEYTKSLATVEYLNNHKEEVYAFLKTHIVRVLFKKRNGDSRVMWCTLNEGFVDSNSITNVDRQISTGQFDVYDILAQGLRKITLSSLISDSTVPFLAIPISKKIDGTDEEFIKLIINQINIFDKDVEDNSDNLDSILNPELLKIDNTKKMPLNFSMDWLLLNRPVRETPENQEPIIYKESISYDYSLASKYTYKNSIDKTNFNLYDKLFNRNLIYTLKLALESTETNQNINVIKLTDYYYSVDITGVPYLIYFMVGNFGISWVYPKRDVNKGFNHAIYLKSNNSTKNPNNDIPSSNNIVLAKKILSSSGTYIESPEFLELFRKLNKFNDTFLGNPSLRPLSKFNVAKSTSKQQKIPEKINRTNLLFAKNQSLLTKNKLSLIKTNVPDLLGFKLVSNPEQIVEFYLVNSYIFVYTPNSNIVLSLVRTSTQSTISQQIIENVEFLVNKYDIKPSENYENPIVDIVKKGFNLRIKSI